MEKTQAEILVETTMKQDISEPLQTLFDECLSFISVADFNL